MPSIVLIGGGHAHVNVLKTFGIEPMKSILSKNKINVTLIARDIKTPYSGMLPGYVAGHYTLDEIHIDLNKLCAFSNVKLIHASAEKVECNLNGDEKNGGGLVYCSDGRSPIHFDVMSINVGIIPSSSPITDSFSSDYLTPVKPISSFSTRWECIKNRLRENITSTSSANYKYYTYTPDKPFILLIVGGGAGGVELALSAQYSLQNLVQNNKMDARCIKIILATKGQTILPTHYYKVQNIFINIFKQRDIPIFYNIEAIGSSVSVQSNNDNNNNNDYENKLQTLLLSNDSKEMQKEQEIKFHECLWCTSASAPKWLKENTPFPTTKNGFLKVNDTYQCTSLDYPRVFAAGDCCDMIHHPRPKSGVYAVRAGPPLCQNILSFILKKPLKSFIPQNHALALISTGNKYAIYSKKGYIVVVLQGKYLWLLKDYIDRNWMYQYQQLP